VSPSGNLDRDALSGLGVAGGGFVWLDWTAHGLEAAEARFSRQGWAAC